MWLTARGWPVTAADLSPVVEEELAQLLAKEIRLRKPSLPSWRRLKSGA